MAEHQDLDVLGCVGAGEQRQPAQHAGEHQVCESRSHSERACWAACELLLPGPAAKALIRGRDTVLGTHRRRTRISMSLAVSERARSTIQPRSFANIW